MEKRDLHSRLERKLSECWNAYQAELLALPPERLIEKSAEIAATRFCYDDLTGNPSSYPDYLLEHLLKLDDPLTAVREQWMEEQCMECSSAVEHALWSLWDHGPLPDEAAMGGIS